MNKHERLDYLNAEIKQATKQKQNKMLRYREAHLENKKRLAQQMLAQVNQQSGRIRELRNIYSMIAHDLF